MSKGLIKQVVTALAADNTEQAEQLFKEALSSKMREQLSEATGMLYYVGADDWSSSSAEYWFYTSKEKYDEQVRKLFKLDKKAFKVETDPRKYHDFATDSELCQLFKGGDSGIWFGKDQLSKASADLINWVNKQHDDDDGDKGSSKWDTKIHIDKPIENYDLLYGSEGK